MNVDWIYHLPALLRVQAYFGLQKLIGSRIAPAWREFLSWERFSPGQLETHVESRLAGLLHAACQNSEYYRSLRLRPAAGQNARDFLREFPVLSRNIVRDRFTDLVADSHRAQIRSPEAPAPKKYDWVIVKTGGTTGSPTTVVHDARTRDSGRATRLYALRQAGFPLGTRYFRLWGSEQDLLQTKEKLDRRILRNLLGEIPMNAFRAKEAELARHYATMQGHPEIRHLMSYVDAAVSLAFYIQDRSLPRPNLKTIMACAGTVTPEWRDLLQKTFQADVFDKYGSRDCADMATECHAHQGLHVHSPHVFLEVVDEKNLPCPPGQPGRILVTLLHNQIFPLIRYEIGDLGVWAQTAPCPCGSPFPRLQNLQGRQDDMLTTEDGTLLSSAVVRHFVGVSLNRQLIREWQLEQSGPRTFVFRYIPRRLDGLETNLADLKRTFLTSFGSSADIRLEQVPAIPVSATGKVRWILNTSRSPRPR